MRSRVGMVTMAVVAYGVAGAAPRPTVPALVGAMEIERFQAPTGFIDDAIAFDDTRFAYVVADEAQKCELNVIGPAATPTGPATTPATPAPAAGSTSGSGATPTSNGLVVDLAPITLHPLTLKLMGPRVFVTGLDANNAQVAALVELSTGKPVYKLGPAKNITVITPDGTTWSALKADPVNPDAVARKKPYPEYVDIFKAGRDGKAVRKVRVLAT